MKKAVSAITAALVITLSGCATHSNEISAAYVSESNYRGWNCDQLTREMRAISRRVGILTGQIDDEADDDEILMGVGLVLFWPALFFLDGNNNAQQAEYAQLKGEYDALENLITRKQCETTPETPPAKAAN